jgi:hypothetical protein
MKSKKLGLGKGIRISKKKIMEVIILWYEHFSERNPRIYGIFQQSNYI